MLDQDINKLRAKSKFFQRMDTIKVNRKLGQNNPSMWRKMMARNWKKVYGQHGVPCDDKTSKHGKEEWDQVWAS